MTTPSDIIGQAINFQLSGVNTCLPAEIISYDFTKQKASVQPLLKVKFTDGTIDPMPIIENVPVIFPSSKDFHISFPLNEGDTVLLLFSQRSIDNWLSTGGEVVPNDPRKFDLSDAIAIPGLRDFSQTSPAEDNTTFTLQLGSAKFKIDPSGTYCFKGATEELMSILDELFTAIEAITVAADQAMVPNPAIPINNLATFTALQARFNTLKGNC